MINSKLVPVIVVMLLLGLSHGLAYWSGQSAEQQRWQLADAARECYDNAAINDLQQLLRRTESASAGQLLAAETRYQKGLADVQAEKPAFLLLMLLALPGCQSPSKLPAAQLQALRPTLPATAPIQRHAPNFQTRLLDFLSGSPQSPTPSP